MYFSAYYEINSLVRLVFNLNCNDEDYLYYVGAEYSTLCDTKKYEKEINGVLKKLKDDGFIITKLERSEN